MNQPKYVCAFNRDRDSYQIPLALAENEMLEKFITDYYVSPRIKIKGLQHRHIDGIESELTSSTLKAVAIQAAWKKAVRILPNLEFPEMKVDQSIASHVSRYTRTSHSNLFVYNNYAKTFGDSWNKEKLRVLFQFHPTPSFINKLMRDFDIPVRAQEPEVRFPDLLAKQSDVELVNSSHIFCASSFTKKSLIFSGYPEEKISVIPYGSPPPTIRLRKEKSGPLRFVFLGSAVRRKGLDLLLKVWPIFHSLTGSELYVVSRIRDKTIDLPEHPGITYSGGLNAKDLADFLCEMDALVLPSLIEGFGLVITEALSAGLHVVATENTGLLDLNLPSTVGTLISGEVSHENVLSGLSKSASEILKNRNEIPGLAQKFSTENSWTVYREKLSHQLGIVEQEYFNAKN
jgi:glycosyltransferase involved in cell wall biosynthesis